MRTAIGWALALLLLTLAACGGGGQGAGPTPAQAEQAPIARIDILQTGLLLTSVGATKSLSAVAYDAKGSVVSATFSWTSTSSAVIGVDQDGKVTAASASGSSQVAAEAEGVKSDPLLVVVTSVPAGAVLLSDAQIVGDPVATDSSAAPSFDSTYKVVLSGVAAPSVDSLLINTESKAVAGRVVGVETAGGATTVTLRLASARELFPNLNLNEVIDLPNATVAFAPGVEAAYTVKRVNDTFTFIPKVSAAPASSGATPGARIAAVATSALAPFDSCDATIPGRDEKAPLPIVLGSKPTISLKLNPRLEVVYTAANGLERFVVAAPAEFKIEADVSVTAAFEGKIECKQELMTYPVPVGGALSLVIGGKVPVGIAIEAGGKMTLAKLAISGKFEAKARPEIGVACTGNDCTFVRDLGATTVQAKPTLTLPSAADLKVEPSLSAFLTMKAAIGNPFLNALQLEAFKVKAGAKLAGSFANQTAQILDTNYKSDYKVTLEASAAAGKDVDGALKLLGVSAIDAPPFTLSVILSSSPIASPSGAIKVSSSSSGTNPNKFQPGDTLAFTVSLDPASVNFLGDYNVERVLLVRKTGILVTEIGRVKAVAGQTDFSFHVTATDSGATSEFTAFAVTALLPLDPLSLEIGALSATNGAVQISAGLRNACALLANGQVNCWGYNGHGELGNGVAIGTGGHAYSPVSVVGIETATSVAVGGNHVCALLADTTVKCWGYTEGWDYGNPDPIQSSTPLLMAGVTGVKTLTAGTQHTCALLANGTAQCWGDNRGGQLGNGSTNSSTRAVPVAGITDAIALSAGYTHSCALFGNGTVKCWGSYNLYLPTPLDSTTPALVGGIDTAKAISAGAGITCALLADGRVKCWGLGFDGSLGNGGTADSWTPVLVSGIDTAIAVSAGTGFNACALLADGSLRCWGNNSVGQLGNGTSGVTSSSTTKSSIPVAVNSINTAVAVSTGGESACALLVGGLIQCWGGDGSGQLGDGVSTGDSATPVSVVGFP